MGNLYLDPEPCNLWGPDGQCGALETRRYVNGWYCPNHAPHVLAGRPAPQSTAHLYKPVASGPRISDWGEVIRQNKRARIDGKRKGS